MTTIYMEATHARKYSLSTILVGWHAFGTPFAWHKKSGYAPNAELRAIADGILTDLVNHMDFLVKIGALERMGTLQYRVRPLDGSVMEAAGLMNKDAKVTDWISTPDGKTYIPDGHGKYWLGHFELDATGAAVKYERREVFEMVRCD